MTLAGRISSEGPGFDAADRSCSVGVERFDIESMKSGSLPSAANTRHLYGNSRLMFRSTIQEIRPDVLPHAVDQQPSAPLPSRQCVGPGGCLEMEYLMCRGHIAQLRRNGLFQFPSRGYLVNSISCFLLLGTARIGMGVIDALI